MRRKVKITKAALPKAKAGMNISSPEGAHPAYKGSVLAPGTFLPSGNGSQEELKLNTTLKPVDRENATLEAEKGETVITNLNQGGIPEFYNIGGKRHSQGGTPLNLPADSFIFSRDNKLKIKDGDILREFGYPVKGKKSKKAYTPADISKKFNLNKYQKVLMNPDSDRIERETAEMMIQNYNLKLGKLALYQESIKGFPDEIPAVAFPYMESVGLQPQDFFEQPQAQQQQAPMPEMAQGKYGGSLPNYKKGGQTKLPKAQFGNRGLPKGSVVRQMPDGTLEIVNKRGKVVGRINTSNVQPYKPVQMPMIGDTGYKPVQMPMTGSSSNVPPVQMPGLYYPGAPGYYGPGTVTQAAGQTYTTSTKTTKKYNIPKDATVHDETAEGFDPQAVKPNDYVKDKDGKYRKATGYKSTPFEGNIEDYDKRLAGAEGRDHREAFGRLEQAIMNNPDLQAAMVKKYQDTVKDLKAQGLLSDADIKKMQAMEPDEIIKTYLAGNKQNMIIDAHKGEIGALEGSKSDDWDTKLVTVQDAEGNQMKMPQKYYEISQELGFMPMDAAHTGAFQAMYKGMNELSGDPQFKDILGDFAMLQTGHGDEKYSGVEGGQHKGKKKGISKIDGWSGDTTIGEMQAYADKAKELQYEDVKMEEVKEQTKHLAPYRAAPKAEPWVQDEINLLGAVGDFARIQKMDPWQATPGFKMATPALESPERALNAIGAMAAAGARGASTFAGPQQFASRYGAMQRNAANQAANAIAQTHNRNVRTLNQFELANTRMFNQHANTKSQLATNLYDKYTVANQQYINAKNKAREQMRKQGVNLITNMAKTQAMNALFPDYAVDPQSGGMLAFTPSYRQVRDEKAGTTITDSALGIKNANPGMTYEEALKYANAQAGKVQTNPALDRNANYYNNYMNASSHVGPQTA